MGVQYAVGSLPGNITVRTRTNHIGRQGRRLTGGYCSERAVARVGRSEVGVLAGFGDLIEVLGPPELITGLLEVADQLRARYASRSDRT